MHGDEEIPRCAIHGEEKQKSNFRVCEGQSLEEDPIMELMTI